MPNKLDRLADIKNEIATGTYCTLENMVTEHVVHRVDCNTEEVGSVRTKAGII